jgi:hypothetical protein
MGAQDKAAEAFKAWGRIIDVNKFRQQNNLEQIDTRLKEAPYASLIEFFRDSPKRTHLD